MRSTGIAIAVTLAAVFGTAAARAQDLEEVKNDTARLKRLYVTYEDTRVRQAIINLRTSSSGKDEGAASKGPERPGTPPGKTAKTKAESDKNRRPTFLELSDMWQSNSDWVEDRAGHHAAVIASQSRQGKELDRALGRARQALAYFKEKRDELIAGLLEGVPACLGGAESMAKSAVEGKRPLLFTGGVCQQLGGAERSIEILGALLGPEDERVKKFSSDLAEMRKRVEEIAAALKEEILATTEAPQDAYEGDDKETLARLVLAQWKKWYADDQVLAVRFTESVWDRTLKSTWDRGSKSWTEWDYSQLHLAVIVRTNDRIATIYGVHLFRNNLNESTEVLPADPKREGGREMLAENFK